MQVKGSLFVAVLLAYSTQGRIDPPEHYSNEWIVRMSGGPEEAQLLALQFDYKYKGEVPGFKDTYRLEKTDHPKRHKRDANHLTTTLSNDDRVIWAEQEEIRKREKRDFIVLPESQFLLNNNFKIENNTYQDIEDEGPSNYNYFERDRRSLGDITNGLIHRRTKQSSRSRFNDPLWMDEWYLYEKKKSSLSMNVVDVWDMGVTGRDVRVVILDDGIERSHTDLKENYDARISYDMNDGDNDPTPQYNSENAHGTRCAGQIAMIANNKKCGVGIAYNAKIGGIRMLDGPVTDRVEGGGLRYANELVDIYSASWGPTDDGATVDGPGKLAMESFIQGVTKGRNGSGAIFVWASGNGGGKGDSCSCDGYVNSIYTLTVSSVTQELKFPWYGERCAATLTTTYSSGSMFDRMIATVDLKDQCTKKHTGTSASAPMAAGIIALALEARPSLTWRDVQHILVLTSRPQPLMDNPGWKTNGAGHKINPKFGFGLMDAQAMVQAAREWVNVPPQTRCTFSYPISNQTLHTGRRYQIKLKTDCEDVRYLEHVELEVNIKNNNRGALEVYLTSPQGTKEQILYQRRNDESDKGFNKWKFLSVLTWNENPKGNWKVEIIDTCIACEHGTIGDLGLTIYGTKQPPFYAAKKRIEKNEIRR